VPVYGIEGIIKALTAAASASGIRVVEPIPG